MVARAKDQYGGKPKGEVGKRREEGRAKRRGEKEQGFILSNAAADQTRERSDG